MNKLVLALVLLMINYNAMAEKKSPTEKAKEKTEEMQKDLSLTAEQNKKIYEVNLKAYTAISEYDVKKPSKKLKKKQKDIVQSMRDEQYKKILSAAQYKKYKELKKKEKEEEKRKAKELEKLK